MTKYSYLLFINGLLDTDYNGHYNRHPFYITEIAGAICPGQSATRLTGIDQWSFSCSLTADEVSDHDPRLLIPVTCHADFACAPCF